MAGSDALSLLGELHDGQFESPLMQRRVDGPGLQISRSVRRAENGLDLRVLEHVFP